MIKLTRFLLPICIFLFSGYFQQNRHAYNESISYSSIQNLEGSAFTGCTALQNNSGQVMMSALSGTEKENSSNHLANFEEKEDELASFKKHVDFSNDFAIAFDTLLPGYFSQYINQCLFFYKHFSYLPSYRSLYLKFQVLRI